MKQAQRRARLMLIALTAGAVVPSSCLSNIVNTADLFLGPFATSNLIQIPHSAFSGLIEAFNNIWFG
jgi:hypothetical protein